MDLTTEISGYTLEYFDDTHTYLVDGVIVPSVTQILKHKFGNKYAHIPKDVLQRAANKGTQVHEAIEQFCRTGEMADFPEVRNFEFLRKKFGFTVKENETPVILFDDGKPIAAGRLDLVLEMDNKVGGADIKRTSALDKEYLAYQLNLYRIAYKQCYGVEWEFLKGVHLRDDVRRFVDIPINEDIAWQLVQDFLKGGKNE